ncbi:hypothetical protein BR93DRAFT_428459 [Coniochaeta sp. PMI_546]|nr:hypothetical protein BR93DRAFT_428459 [Coniochaeta sp. PMI_546]
MNGGFKTIQAVPDPQMHPANQLRFQDGDLSEMVCHAVNGQSDCSSASSGERKSGNRYNTSLTMLLCQQIEGRDQDSRGANNLCSGGRPKLVRAFRCYLKRKRTRANTVKGSEIYHMACPELRCRPTRLQLRLSMISPRPKHLNSGSSIRLC